MKKALVLFVFVHVFRVSALYSQDKPFAVDGCVIRPAVVKSWEPFEMVCRLRFLDLSASGREVRVFTDKLEPGKISFGNFEADDDFRIEKDKNDEEYIWHVIYTLRRIGPRKSQDTIPEITFQWSVKQIGQSVEEDIEFSKSREIPVIYVSTIPDQNNLYIRDEIDFGRFRTRSYVLRGFAVIVLLVGLSILFKELFFGSAVGVVEEKDERGDTTSSSPTLLRMIPTLSRARSELEKIVKTIRKKMYGGVLFASEEARAFEIELHGGIRNVLLAQVPELSGTPKDMVAQLSRNPRDKKKKSLVKLARILSDLQGGIDSNNPGVFLDSGSVREDLENVLYLSRSWKRRVYEKCKKRIGKIRRKK